MALAPVAPTLAPPPAAPPADNIPPPPDSVGQAGAAAVAAEQQLGPRLSAVNKQENERLASLDKQWNEVPRPEFKPPPQPTVQSTDPKAVWASSAMVLAAIGSLFTRQPLVTAINAAAQVLDAYHAGDQAKANAAFQTWKIANDNYVKAFTLQNDSYNQVRQHIGDLQTMTMQQAEAVKRDAIAETDALAHAYNDQAMLQLHEWDDKVQLQQFREGQFYKQIEAGDKIEHEHNISTLIAASDSEHPNDTPEQRARRHIEIMSDYGQTHPESPYQVSNIENGLQKGLSNSLVGKNWNSVEARLDSIEAFKANRNAVQQGVIPQALLQDAFTKIINGGTAIRGFQAKMNTEHSGLWDRAQVALQTFNKGGNLSPRMQQDMIDMAEQVAVAMDKDYGEEISRAMVRARGLGPSVTPQLVVPSEYDPNKIPSMLGAPLYPTEIPEEAAALLVHDHRPNADEDFDQHFGPGAAIRARNGIYTMEPSTPPPDQGQ
jgi:hypothetical protein